MKDNHRLTTKACPVNAVQKQTRQRFQELMDFCQHSELTFF